MSKTYQYSGLTEELYQRLVSEHASLKKAHKKGSYKQFFQDVKQCSELQARIIYQAFNAAVVERARISPATVDRLEGIISDELFNDLQDYLSTNYTRGEKPRANSWIKLTQDCQSTFSSGSVKKWKHCARNTLTT